MADIITGQITTLPGSEHPVPLGTVCDVHTHNRATHRIQGVTDAMSAHLHDMCDICYDIHMGQQENDAGICSICGQHSDHLTDYQNFRNGFDSAPEPTCPDCIREDQESVIDEVMPEIEDLSIGHEQDDDGLDPDRYLPRDD